MSIEDYLKVKAGYRDFYYNPEITKMHNEGTSNGIDNNPFVSHSIDSRSKGCVQVDTKNPYHKLTSEELHAKALLISQ